MWKELEIDGLNKKYLINEDGDIFDIKEKKLRKPEVSKRGYLRVSFYLYGKYKKRFVHRLVLATFNPVENMDKLQVNHIDGNKQNNNINNLEWCTNKENLEHAWKTGLCSNCICNKSGDEAHHKKFSSEKVKLIKQDLKNGISYRQIGKKYDIAFSTVSQIANGITWKDV